MNKPDDLWGICLFLKVNYLGGSYWNFVNQYCRIEEDYWGKKIGGATDDPLKIAILKETLNLFWVRNPQNMVSKGAIESTVDLEMYPAQKKLYSMVRRLAIEELDQAGISIANAMVQMMRLQQLTSDPCSFEGYTEGNPKFDWITDLLEDNPELKICVFSKFKKAIIALQQKLGNEICVAIHGDISAKIRENNKNRFIQEPSTRVIAGTIGAMSEGIDGLQKVCHIVVFIDKAWNPEESNQAIARIVRLGQEYRVNVYYLDCMNTIDKHLGKVALSKMEDIKELIWRDH
jgi:SNF2 family DNA or RNA helicase